MNEKYVFGNITAFFFLIIMSKMLEISQHTNCEIFILKVESINKSCHDVAQETAVVVSDVHHPAYGADQGHQEPHEVTVHFEVLEVDMLGVVPRGRHGGGHPHILIFHFPINS